MPTENLVELAAYEFDAALRLCVDCNDYHALWGYIRLTRVTSKGFETERDILEPLLRGHALKGARVLIAGAADAGLLALVTGALDPKAVNISVADRCPTPLAICRRFASAHGFAIDTIKADLTVAPLSARFDLIFLHNMLMLQPRARHVPLLAHLCTALAPDGALILVNRVRTRAPEEPPPPEHFAARIVQALAAQDVALPEPEEAFLHRLERYARVQRSWSDAVVDLPHVESSLAAAGFAIERRIDHERRRTAPDRDGGSPVPMPTNIFVARRRTPG